MSKLNRYLAHVVRCQAALDDAPLCAADWDEVMADLQMLREVHGVRVEQAGLRQAAMLQQQYDFSGDEPNYKPRQKEAKVKPPQISKLTRAQLFLLMDYTKPVVLMDPVFKPLRKGGI